MNKIDVESKKIPMRFGVLERLDIMEHLNIGDIIRGRSHRELQIIDRRLAATDMYLHITDVQDSGFPVAVVMGGETPPKLPLIRTRG